MSRFKTYQPYQLDLERIDKLRLRMLDQQKKVISERPFLEVLREILGRDGYEIKKPLSCTLPALVISIQGEEIRVEPQNSNESYLLNLFVLCLQVGKEGWLSEWLWYFVEDDRVIEDPGTAFVQFFICESGKILRDRVVLSDIPDDLLKEKVDYFFYTDRESQTAETRQYYHDFFKNSRYGQLLMNRIKNKRDEELFGSMSPYIDEFPLAVVVARMDSMLRELRWQRWTLVVAFIVIAAILFFK